MNYDDDVIVDMIAIDGRELTLVKGIRVQVRVTKCILCYLFRGEILLSTKGKPKC